MGKYWIFQYTTTVYKTVIEDFKNEKIKMWEVTKHKKNIKKNDIAIIYIGGPKGKAIYGVAELTSDIFYVQEKQKDYISINIIENWSSSPIPYSIAKKNIDNILIGISGTNFRANKEQYLKIKALVN